MPIRTVQYDGEPSALVQALPFYKLVDKGDPDKPGGGFDHKKYREKVERNCEDNPEFREVILERCRQDPLFWINTFCQVVEPRRSVVLPFNTWPHQDTVIAEMHKGWGREDFVGKKSREQGASWMMAALYVWAFTFLKNMHLGFGSKDEDTADDPDDLGSFGAKLDFLLDRMPHWMQPGFKRHVARHTWRRPGSGGNTIKGFSATAGIARGGRFTVFFLDEAAFFPPGSDYEADANLQRVTDSAIWWSTPNGLNNAFSDKVHGENNWTLMVLSFLDNPAHNKGRYTTTAGRLQVLDGEVDPNYDYELDGRERSKWLDKQWLRAGRDLLFIDQELYMNFGGSKGRPFPQVVLDRARLNCCPPIETGMLLYNEYDPGDQRSLVWTRGSGYKFDLWRPVDHFGRVFCRNPLMGADISAGTAGDISSNSVLWIMDGAEQIGEIAINTIPPVEFARLAVAVCWWLSPEGRTFFCWEKNGPQGTTFTDEMMRLNYANVYYASTGGDEQRQYVQKSDKPGYHNSKLSMALTPFLSALTRQEITVRSMATLAEAGEYEITDTARWVHPRSVNSRDSSARGESHGDRVVAAAMACRGLRERRPQENKPKEVSNQHTMAGRMARVEEVRYQRRLASCRF